jgi:hypothetical protein
MENSLLESRDPLRELRDSSQDPSRGSSSAESLDSIVQLVQSIPTSKVDALIDANLSACKKRKREESVEGSLVRASEALQRDPRTRKYLPGDVFMKRAREDVERLGPYSSKQMEYIDVVLLVMTPIIYGEDFDRARTRLLAECKRAMFPTVGMLLTWRQFGKSTATMAVCAGFILHLRRKHGVCMSATNTNAEDNLSNIVASIYKLGAGHRILSATKKVLLVAAADVETIVNKRDLIKSKQYNKLAVISNSERNKGITPDYILVDEASLVKEKTTSELLAPLMKKGTRVIFLSTNRGADNHYSIRFEQKESDTLAPQVVKKNFDMICDECGGDPEKMLHCHHKDWMLPDWNLAQNDELARSFIPDNDTYLREVKNVITRGSKGGIFADASLKKFKEQPRVLIERYSESTLFTFVDPAGGGGSEWGLISFVMGDGGILTVVGLQTFRTQDIGVIRTYLIAYASAIQNHPTYGAFPHYVIVENNFGGHPLAQLYAQFMLSVMPQALEFETQQGHGATTSSSTKESGITILSVLLENGCVRLAREIVSAQPSATDRFADELHNQLARIRFVNGKITGKDRHLNDDLAMSLVLGIHNATRLAVIHRTRFDIARQALTRPSYL